MRKSRPKFGNKKVFFEGRWFDSSLEQKRYMVLKDAEKKGIISDIQCQVAFELLPNQYIHVIKHLKTKDKIVEKLVHRKVIYTADFTYIKDGELVVEDTKPNKFLHSADFPLRKKMLMFFHKHNLKEVYKENEQI